MYETQNFLEGDILTHEQLNHIEKGIVAATPAHNLLDNSNFAEPVNQRDASSYTTAGAYGIDRWFIGSGGTMTVNNSSVSITGTAKQRILNAKQNGTYTLAVQTASGTVQILTTHGWDSSASCYYVEIPAGEYTWAALYEGVYTTENLPPYMPKGFAVEYAECQRYFVSPVGRFTPIVLTATTTARMTIITAAPMRKVPTATLLNGDNIILNNGSGKVLSVTGVAVDSMEGNHVYLSLTCSEGPQYAAGSTFVTSISLSADT